MRFTTTIIDVPGFANGNYECATLDELEKLQAENAELQGANELAVAYRDEYARELRLIGERIGVPWEKMDANRAVRKVEHLEDLNADLEAEIEAACADRCSRCADNERVERRENQFVFWIHCEEGEARGWECRAYLIRERRYARQQAASEPV